MQSLTVQDFFINIIVPTPVQYFGHLSPTLRSLTLDEPHCTSLQLSHFISLFPNLDNVIIRDFEPLENYIDQTFIPLSTPKLGGKLVLVSSDVVWVEHLAVACGLRFKSIHAGGVVGHVPSLLAACAETLETFEIDLIPDGGMRPCFHLTMNLS